MTVLPERPPTLKERGQLLVLAERNPVLREEIRQRCREDVAWFVNFACWTFDPRLLEEGKSPHLPFILYDYQVDLLRWYEERFTRREDGVVVKSRDMGASWCAIVWLLWHWLFTAGFQALIGSRTEELVDNRLIDSHFGRLDYLLGRLPAWLKPKGFSPRKHRFHMKLINPETGAVGLFTVPLEQDLKPLVLAVKRTPVLERARARPLKAQAGRLAARR